jgi:hypothetical protein
MECFCIGQPMEYIYFYIFITNENNAYIYENLEFEVF